MIRKFLGVGMFGLLLFFSIPQDSQAYLTTGQTAVKVHNQTYLFTVAYDFGSDKYAFNMPVGAVRGLSFGDASPYAGYTIYRQTRDGLVPYTKGMASGLVLSQATLADNTYSIPRGEGKKFVLVAALSLSLAEVAELGREDLFLQVTSLPFKIKTIDGEAFAGKLNPSELQYYKTPTI